MTSKPLPCSALCGICASCSAYRARRDARISNRVPAAICPQTAAKLAPLLGEPKAALALPRGRSGLLAGIGGPLSTRRAGVRLSMAAGALTWRVQAGPQDTAPMTSTGTHVAPAPVPESAHHASVEAECRRDAAATHAPTRVHLMRGLIARERGLP